MITSRVMPAVTGRMIGGTMDVRTTSSPQPMQSGGSQGRGRAAMLLAERIGRLAATQQREDVTPDMEPESPSLSSGEGDAQFDDADNDALPEAENMEPMDASIESAIVEGDETEVTITAEPGEVLVVDELGDGTVIVDVDDEP